MRATPLPRLPRLANRSWASFVFYILVDGCEKEAVKEAVSYLQRCACQPRPGAQREKEVILGITRHPFAEAEHAAGRSRCRWI